MSKFKVKFKLQGLELEIEGSREDVPAITEQLSQQVSNILQPAANIVDADVIRDSHRDPISTFEKPKTKPPRKSKTHSRKIQLGSSQGNSEIQAIDWIHDPAKWGSPKQDWKTSDKAIWLLYVVHQEKQKSELSSEEIEKTFNKHFKQSKLIRKFTISRDLGKLKTTNPVLVSENTTTNPPTWFLTHEGDNRAKELIAESRTNRE